MKVVTVKDLAERWMCSEHSVRIWADRGLLPFQRVEGRRLFDLEEVLKAVAAWPPHPPNRRTLARRLRAG